jgi:hypothetical protein
METKGSRIPLMMPCGEPPDLQDWERQVRNAPDEDLRALQDTAYLALRMKGDGFRERYAAYISAVEEEIQRRRITP